MIDMSEEAITERVRAASRMSPLRLPHPSHVDMSEEGIARRLREVSALWRLGNALVAAGASLAAAHPEKAQ